MRRNFRRRFWAELSLASFTGLLALVTPIFPDWIELVSGWDPDQHDGSVERLIVVFHTDLTRVFAASYRTATVREPVSKAVFQRRARPCRSVKRADGKGRDFDNLKNSLTF